MRSWVATPVGQRSVWQLSDWMQPSANMKPRAELHQSAPSAMARAMSKAVMILPAAPSLMRSRAPMPTSALWTKLQAVAQRHAEMVHEFERRRAGAAFLAVDHDEVRDRCRSRSIALQIARNSQGWPMQSLKPAGLPPDKPPHRRDELHHLDRGREGGVARRRDAVLARRHAADRRDLGRDLGAGQHAAMAGLGALAQLELDHLDLLVAATAREVLGREAAVEIAAAEIAGADLPDDVAAHLAMIGAEAAFAGIMREAALLGAGVQSADGVGLKAPKLMAEMLKTEAE